jgi:hypothetical protein
MGERERVFVTGDRVVKDSGDYTFEGQVRNRFRKTSGALRYVVEDDRGLLFIFNQRQLRLANPTKQEG